MVACRLKFFFILLVPLKCTRPLDPLVLNGRLSCDYARCPGRPAGESACDNKVEDGVDEGIPEEEFQLEGFEEEEPDADADAIVEALSGAGGGQTPDLENGGLVATKIFCLAHPIAFYCKLFNDVLGARGARHCVLLTRTAHPAAIVAARRFGLSVTAYITGASPHSLYHGRELLNCLLVRLLRLKKQQRKDGRFPKTYNYQ
jgi:hypothetical protein